MKLNSLLKALVKYQGSDLFITPGMAPSIKVHGEIKPTKEGPLTPEEVEKLVLGSMNDHQKAEYLETNECQYAIGDNETGRFRVSAFVHQGHRGMVIRRIENVIPTPESLSLPSVLKSLINTKRGILLFVGATGTGKSTSLAALIGHRNKTTRGHIITIEDPIEYVHQHDGCIVTQREVGVDTASFEIALKSTLRQAPDVILIGEIRNEKTMQYALQFAETGHLVLATLHANNANQALDRIIHFFPHELHEQVWTDLSLNLKGIAAQQLIQSSNKKGRVLAVEILVNTPLIADHIRKGEVHMIKPLMERSSELDMQTFDQALFELFRRGEINYEDALRHSDSPNNLRLLIKMSGVAEGAEMEHVLKDLKISEEDPNDALPEDLPTLEPPTALDSSDEEEKTPVEAEPFEETPVLDSDPTSESAVSKYLKKKKSADSNKKLGTSSRLFSPSRKFGSSFDDDL